MTSPSAASATQHLAIVTGASRGLGHALAAALLVPGTHVLTMSRAASALPVPAGAQHDDWQVDLAEPLPVAERLAAWLAHHDARHFASASFIHNAAALSTPAPLADVPLGELQRAARVNLEAPLVLSAAFLRATAAWPGTRKLLFISSGLARSAMAGAASYCATKAGLDHLARALALEEAGRGPNGTPGARIVSLAPGVIDTDMQVQLRGADPAAFPDIEVFRGFKSGGQLDSPATAAAKVIACLNRADFGTNPVGDVRDA
jgi:NAD(P)-dependent dehydrogenase (short-subunit alcohol dehydrogenase family)